MHNNITYLKNINGLKITDISHDLVSQLSVRLDNPFLTREITLLLSTQCNIRCKYCCNYYPDDPVKIPHSRLLPAVATKFLHEYLAYQARVQIKPPVRQIVFSGGEATLNPDVIFSVLDFMRSRKLHFFPVLLTNGVISTSLLEELIKSNIIFQISFDGGSNPLRISKNGKAIHEKILHTIERVTYSKLPLNLRATISKETVSTMCDIVRFAYKHKIETVIFAPLHVAPIYKGSAMLELSDARTEEEEYVKNYFKAYHLAKSLGIMISAPELIRYHTNGTEQELSKLNLLPDGSISMRSDFLSEKAAIFNDTTQAIIGKCDFLNGIVIYKDRIEKILNNFLQNERKLCGGCECRIWCRGRNQNLYKLTEETVKPYNEDLSSKNTIYDEYSCNISRKIYAEFSKS